MGSSSGSGSSQQPVTTQVQNTDPWVGVQGYLSGMYGQADALRAQNLGYQPWTGPTQVGLDPELQQSLASTASLGASELGGSNTVNAARDLALQQVQNYGLSPQQQTLLSQVSGQENPYLQGVINQQVNQANAAASGMGRYGSGAHDAAIAQAIAPTLSQDYARRQQMQQDIMQGGLQRAGQWAQNIPTLDQARYAGAQALGGVGQFLTGRNQQALQDQINLYNAQQAYPWENLSREAAILQGSGGLGGSKITTTNQYLQQPSMLQRVLGGGLAGAGLGSAIAPGIGTGIGALGGGLLGLL